MANRLGFTQVNDLGKYLGVPLIHGRVRSATYGHILENLRARLSGLKPSSLTLGGRITIGGDNEARKLSGVGWEEACKPRDLGGLGLKKPLTMNKAFVMKLGWGLVDKLEALLVKAVRGKYGLPHQLGPNDLRKINGSSTFNSIRKVWKPMLQEMRWALHDGRTIRFWEDAWVMGFKPLRDLATRPIPRDQLAKPVAEFLNMDGQWAWPWFQSRLQCR
ncbi:OLC1v1004005C1 [Oldenlandia corymbosa var. corymbosa]|uniref:OLC1v1004005C1 n=1 Tax=Oldenlandia corymbosa var. corymbosa TaxID=529605 RepID=A0AAV1DBC5_OLDCO|nr:OLC1v1004005C1 [Oldenlandia corymbosa var. corymbosa]